MATIITCPQCGGARNAPPGHPHPCTCSNPPEITADQLVVVGEKVCCACGKDVSHAKRMKDSKGNYWCYECGKTDRSAMKGSAASPPKIVCPICKKKVPTVTLLMDGGLMVCPQCYKNKRSGGKVVDVKIESQAGSSGKIAMIVGGLLAASIAVYFLFVR